MSDVTRILTAIEAGDTAASEELLPLVYRELRRLAEAKLSREQNANSVQPTMLVHEAYLRLVDVEEPQRWNGRGHFFAAAAEAMRRILVENARRKRSLKRGGDRERVPFDAARIAAPHRERDLLALDETLSRLSEERPEMAQLVSLRYFAGLTMPEAAEAMKTSLRTAERNWAYAKAWLMEALANDEEGEKAVEID